MLSKKQNRAAFVTLLVIAILSGNKLIAQNTRYNTSNFNGWVALNSQLYLNDNFGIHAEVQIRRNNGFNQWQQLLLRPGIFYNINSNLTATAGYCFVETYPYGQIPIAKVAFPEHRIWQQVQLTQKTGNVDITNRLRLEQRFFGDASVGTFTNTRYENRLRYMLRVAIPLTTDASKVTKLYLPVYDEVLIAFGKNVKYNTFDQNRFGAGIGLNTGKTGKIEVGYMYQYVQQRNLQPDFSQVVENNHTLSITWATSLKLYKKR
ncbi:uncharacterized protein DUF2490 [Mucilaginibacter gracilis]|uniref:Uncharacterized protein DUF2490 n=1 Tax=Mucilaginibacter gracilis TaxID=423350 RepID=A0A495IU05_9SPHI|nr:DUF2490 domain-containing protein [Mucilaginibacter gracilis]RKR80235.1 uncharacterized protein DUF2490 [Mucilaginibacter gracilis]